MFELSESSSILVTGGTGSFGRHFVSRVLSLFPNINRLVVFSRDELKQYEMSMEFSERDYPGLRYFLGDIRDAPRLAKAFEGIDLVVHAAALKQVVAAEYNPFECIKTNILGTQNVVEAAIAQKVAKVVALSTDKASSPVNLYGATKLCADKLIVNANFCNGMDAPEFCVVRYGNVANSRGSVIPLFRKQSSEGKFTITDNRMTRFLITLDQGVDEVFWSIQNDTRGVVVVPKLPSFNVIDLASVMNPDAEQAQSGIRPGEKLHEEMISHAEGEFTREWDTRYFILSSMDNSKPSWFDQSVSVPRGFLYQSDTNSRFLSKKEIRDLINTL